MRWSLTACPPAGWPRGDRGQLAFPVKIANCPRLSHIESLKLTIGDDGTIVDTLQVFRAKRGGGIDERTGIASDQEIEELRSLATRLRDRVLEWLRKHHPGLLAADPGGKRPARKKRTK